VILTNSSIGTFQFCERKYYWRYRRGLVPRKTNELMAIGTYFHQGMEVLLTDMTEEGRDRAIASIDLVAAENSEAAHTGRFLIARYYDHWSTKVPSWVEVIAPEKTILVPAGQGRWVAGKLDGLVADDQSRLWIVEHKTTYAVDADYLEKVELDGQITHYMMLAEAEFGTLPAGVWYNTICRPRIYRRKDEDIFIYLTRAAVEYRSQPLSYVARQRAYRSATTIAEHKETVARVADRIDSAIDVGFWCKNCNTALTCFARGRRCPYTALCTHGETPLVLADFEHAAPHSELDLPPHMTEQQVYHQTHLPEADPMGFNEDGGFLFVGPRGVAMAEEIKTLANTLAGGVEECPPAQ